jgi:SAM-dependent methyltransferase
MSTENLSHEAHANWYEKVYSDTQAQEQAIKNWKNQHKNQNISGWIHQRLFALVEPFLVPDKSWLTVGDGYGFDANYFYEKGIEVTATDIAGTFLPISKAHGLIENYAVENVERLSFQNESFDYVFCKEAYHHFPRPYLAVYEMLRVAREGIVIIEPHDPLSKMPLLLAMRNILDRIDTKLLQRYWKNRYSFEEVGNYVFKLSEREIDKLANGIGLPGVAFKGINNNYYSPKTATESANDSSAAFRKIKRKLSIHNLLTKLGMMPAQVLCALIFKKVPSENQLQKLREAGFQIHLFPTNPYLKG